MTRIACRKIVVATWVLAVAITALPARDTNIVAQNEGATERHERDKTILEEYRTGKRDIRPTFFAIHNKPVAGQLGTYRNYVGLEKTFRVQSARERVCIVEQRLEDSDIVLAVEFELAGMIANVVRRAWAGRVGDKPAALTLKPPAPTPDAGGVGLNGRYETSEEAFTDFEQGGMKWSGKLHTLKYYRSRDKDAPPSSVTRTWTVDDEWFRQDIRREYEEQGQPVRVWEMVKAAEKSNPLLNWSDVNALAPEAEKALREPHVAIANQKELDKFRQGRKRQLAPPGLHAGAKVGDWATYSYGRVTLVALKDENAVIEFDNPDPDSRVVVAFEVGIQDGKTAAVVGTFAALRGSKPVACPIETEPHDKRPAESVSGDAREVELAGRKWKAREIRETRKPLSKRDSDSINELLVADDQPFGLPLRVASYSVGYEQFTRVTELLGVGQGREAGLDWKNWEPAMVWMAPFTTDQVKAFIKVGMTWKYKQELDKGADGLVVREQHWKVTATNETGYEVECRVTEDGKQQAPVKDTIGWGARKDLIEGVPPRGQTKIEKRKLKLADREIDIVVYYFSILRHEKVYALSPDLPGIRICTEETIDFPSKVWMTDFQMPK